MYVWINDKEDIILSEFGKLELGDACVENVLRYICITVSKDKQCLDLSLSVFWH